MSSAAEWTSARNGATTCPRAGSCSSTPGEKIGQITSDIKFEDVCKNDLIDEANAFDAAKVKADADGFELSADYQAVDVEAIKTAL